MQLLSSGPFDKGHGPSFKQTLESSSPIGMLYVKYGGTWLCDCEEVNIWKDMNGHLVIQTDRQTVKNMCFAKHNWALRPVEQAYVNYIKCLENTNIIKFILQWTWH